MKDRLFSVICLALVFPLLAAPVSAQDLVSTDSPTTALAEHVPDELLISFSPGLGSAQRAQKMSEMGVTHMRELPDISVHLVKLPPGLSVEQALERFNRMPGVEFAEPNYILQIADTSPVEVVDQWALNKIQVPKAWEQFSASDKNEVIVADIDTGIDKNRSDLSSHIWINADETPDNGIDDDANGYIDDTWGWDFVNTDNDPMDDNMHGTAVTGVMVAALDGIGVAGVCPWCRAMAVKVIGSAGSGTLDAVASGITYAVDNGAAVINLSLGATAGAQTLEAAVNYAWNNGKVVVAAAGNNGTNTKLYPAAYANAMAVASTNSDDNHSCFSNYADGYISVAAPGERIYVIDINNAETGYGTYSGTSLATPHVSGLAALLFSKYPGLSNVDVRGRIEDSAVDLGSSGIDGVFGHGRIDAYRAMVEDYSWNPPPDSLSSNSDSATGFPHSRKLVRDSSGMLHMIWHTYDNSIYRIRYATSSDNGLTWNLHPDVFASPYESYHPALAIDGDNLYVVIPSRPGVGLPYQVLFTSKPLAGSNWSPATAIIDGNFDAVRPDIFVDPTNGRLNIIASSYDNTTDLYYRSSDTQGGTWNSLSQFSPSTSSPIPNLTRYAAIYAHGDNIYVVTRTVQSIMGYPFYLNMWTVRSTDGGLTWIEKTQISAFQPISTSEYGISLAGVGERIYMAYEYGTGIYFRSNNGTGWSDYLQLETGTSSNVYKWPSITQSVDGQAWMMFELNGQMYKRYYDGTTWQAKELIGRGTYPNLKLGTGDDLVEWVYTICNGSPFNVGYGSLSVPKNLPPQASDQSVTTTEATPVNITLVATDPEGDPLTYSVLSSPAHGSLSGTSPNLSYTPEDGYSGPDSFTFKANDGHLDSNTASVSITVTPANHPPTAVNDAVQTTEGTPVIISVLANDSDPDNDPLTITHAGLAFHGTAQVTDGGTTVTYTPDIGYSGSDSFYYSIADGRGGTDTASVFVSVVQNEYTLTINITGNGTVTSDPPSGPYHYGDVVSLSATPAGYWSFAGWSANVIDNKVTIYGNTTVTATFIQYRYYLSIVSLNYTVNTTLDKNRISVR